jgi:hypothetical protein
VPDLAPILAAHENPKIEEMIPADTRELDNIKALVTTPQKSLDVNTLFQLHKSSVPRYSQQYWFIISTASVCVLTTGLIVGCMLRSRFYYLFHCNTASSTKDSNPVPLDATQQAYAMEQASNTTQSEPQGNIAFTTYTLQAAIP